MKLSFEIWPNEPYGERPVIGPATNSWGDKPLEWTVERLAGYAYQGVDFIFDQFLNLSEQDYERYRRELGPMVRHYGMQVSSLACHSLSITRRKWEREAGLALFMRAIDLGSELGANTVVSFIRGGYYGGSSDHPTYVVLPWKEAWANCVDVVRRAGEYAAEKGMNISVELHQESLIDLPEHALQLLEDVDLDNVYTCIDFGQMNLAVKPRLPIIEAFLRLGDTLNLVHVKDITGTIGHWNMPWFGGGMVNWREYHDGLQAINYQGFLVLEWEGWFRGGTGGRGDPGGIGLQDFDRVAVEGKEFLEKYLIHPNNRVRRGRRGWADYPEENAV